MSFHAVKVLSNMSKDKKLLTVMDSNGNILGTIQIELASSSVDYHGSEKSYCNITGKFFCKEVTTNPKIGSYKSVTLPPFGVKTDSIKEALPELGHLKSELVDVYWGPDWGVGLRWLEEVAAYRKPCPHEFVPYTGLTETYNYCKHCDQKESA